MPKVSTVSKNKVFIGAGILLLIIAIMTGTFIAVLLNQQKNQIDTSPEKSKYEQIEALYRNHSYKQAKTALAELNATSPNSEFTKKANLAFTNFDTLIPQEETEQRERDIKTKQEAEDNKRRADQQQKLIDQQKKERDSHLYIGDTKDKVLKLFGKPERVNRTVTQNVVHEQLVYGDSYIYVENGIVTSWQESQ